MNLELINKIMTEDKKGIQSFANQNALQIIDEGETDLVKEYIKARRLQEYLDNYISGLKKAVKDEVSKNGNKIIEGDNEVILVSGRTHIDYELDTFYADLKKKLDARKLQLDMVRKTGQTAYDSEGCEIPLLPVKGANEDSLMLKMK